MNAVLTACWRGSGPYTDHYRCEVPTLGIAATGRNSVFDLCRALVAANVPDQPMTVVGENGRPRMHIASIHGAARWTVAENASWGPRFVPFQPFPSQRPFPANGSGQKQGVKVVPLTQAASDPSTHLLGTPVTGQSREVSP